MPSQQPLPTPHAGAEGYLDVALLDNGVCALHADGGITCWGDEAMPPPGAFASMVATEYGSCGVRDDGTLICWGGAPRPPEGTFTSVYSGDTWCALDARGHATCWFSPEDDEGDQAGSPVVTRSPSGTWLQLAPPCGIRTNGRVVCWAQVEWDGGPSSLPAGRYLAFSRQDPEDEGSTCGIRRDRSLVCPNLSFMVGESGLSTESHLPVGRFTAVATTGNFACAIRESGALACWGSLARDRAGRAIIPGGHYVAVMPDTYHTGMCAIRRDHAFVCFGGEGSGRAVGPGPGVDPLYRGEVDADAIAVSTGFMSGCVVHADRTLSCWGSAADGAPQAGAYRSVSVGDESACAIGMAGNLICWHVYEDPGSFDGGVTPPGRWTTPEGTFTSLSKGEQATCAIRSDATLDCWSVLPLEDGADWSYKPPAGRFSQVAVGNFGACAVRVDGTLACWAGAYLPPEGTFIAVSVGYAHSCAIRTGGLVECWGEPDSLPFRPEGSFVAIDGDCGIRTDRRLACWGISPDSGETPIPEVGPPAGTFVAIADHCAVRTTGALVCWDSGGVTAVAPSALAIAPRSWVAAGPAVLRWTGSGPVPISSYDVTLRRMAPTTGRDTQVLGGSRKTTLRLPVEPGRTICPRVVAHDSAGLVSEPAYWTCVTFPLDDRSLAVRRGTWTRLRDPAFYRGTALRTSARGATVSVRTLASSLAVVASTCPGCGTIRVHGEGLSDRGWRISLDGPRQARVVFPIDLCDEDGCPDEPWDLSVEITVISSGKPVIIDGIAASQAW